MSETGWIPYDNRTSEQQRDTDAFHERIGSYGAPMGAAELPKLAYLPLLEKKVLGKLQYRVNQVTGSCVGSAANRAYQQATLGDIVHRGDAEQPKILFPFATYGVGRQKAGMRRKGDGSYGGAQAWACENFGTLALDSELNLPQPSIRDTYWMRWSRDVEFSWSHPSAWPIDYATVAAEAKETKLGTVTRVTDPDQARVGLSQGYGMTIASSFGSRNMRVQSGRLMASWNSSWAHQVSVDGVEDHEQLGVIFYVANQWGATAHPVCPFQTTKHGVTGNFAVTKDVMAKILRNGEGYLHTNTDGFPARELDWNEFVWNINVGGANTSEDDDTELIA